MKKTPKGWRVVVGPDLPRSDRPWRLIKGWQMAWGPARPLADRIVLAAGIMGGFVIGFSAQALFHNWEVNSVITLIGVAGLVALMLSGKDQGGDW